MAEETATTPTQAEINQANNYFIAQHEVMFQGIKQYHEELARPENRSLTDDQRLELLITEVNRAAANNDRIPEADRGRIALEWEGAIRTNGGYNTETNRFETPGRIDVFVNDPEVINAAKGDLPTLPKDFSLSVDLRTANLTDVSSLNEADRAAFVRAAPDMARLVALDGAFKDAAQNQFVDAAGTEYPPLIDYKNGGNLSNTLAQYTTNDQSLINKNAAAISTLREEQPLIAVASQQTPVAEGEEKKKEDKNPLASLMQGLDPMMQLILVALVAAFAGKDGLSALLGGSNGEREAANNAPQSPEANDPSLTPEQRSAVKAIDEQYAALRPQFENFIRSNEGKTYEQAIGEERMAEMRERYADNPEKLAELNAQAARPVSRSDMMAVFDGYKAIEIAEVTGRMPAPSENAVVQNLYDAYAAAKQSRLTPEEMATLSTEQVQTLRTERLTPEQVAALTPEQIPNLSAEQISKFPPDSIKNLKVEALTDTQVAALTGEQLAAMTPTQLATIDGSKLSEAQTANLSTLQKEILTDQNNLDAADRTAGDAGINRAELMGRIAPAVDEVARTQSDAKAAELVAAAEGVVSGKNERDVDNQALRDLLPDWAGFLKDVKGGQEVPTGTNVSPTPAAGNVPARETGPIIPGQ